MRLFREKATRMKNILLIIIVSIYSVASTMNQKMIISVGKSSVEAEKVLHTAKLFFDEQKQFPQLNPKIEKLNEYFLVTISPIDTIALKHTLYTVLQAKFSGIFTIDNIEIQGKVSERTEGSKVKPIIVPKAIKTIPKAKEIIHKHVKNVEDEKISFWQNIDREWYALLALAMAGLILILRSTYQIGKIKKLQMKLEAIQEKNDRQV